MSRERLAEAIGRILGAVAVICVHSWIVKELWNWVGVEQGLQPITWLGAIAWLVIGRALTGAGDIVSTLKKSAKGDK